MTIKVAGGTTPVLYTPAWTSLDGATNPAIGNGTLAGQWVAWGSLIQVQVQMVPGSTTTFGDNTEWGFGLPTQFTIYNAPPVGPLNGSGGGILNFTRGTWWAVQHSGSYWTGSVALDNDNTGTNIPYMYLYLQNGASALHTTRPFTWANGDALTMFAEFEIAV